MELISDILTSFIILFGLYLLYQIYIFCKWNYLISLLPGPKTHFLLGNIPDVLGDREDLFKLLRKWGKEFYPIFAIKVYPIPSIYILGPEEIELVISGVKHSAKSLVYEILELWLRKGLLTSNGAKWQTRRKLLTPSFHFNILQHFLPIFQKETEILVEKFEKACNEPVDVMPFITDFTLKSINETSMGITLNFDKKEDKEYHKNILLMGQQVIHRLTRPWLYIHFIYYNFTSSGHQEKSAVSSLHKFTRTMIKKRIDDNRNNKPIIEPSQENSYSKRKRLAMLDLLIDAHDKGLIDLDGICEEVDTFMFEGHDTVSMAICFLLMELANSPQYQNLILEEINSVLGDSTEYTYQKLNDLKFLEMCIKESLRLHPSVPFISRVLEEDVKTAAGHLMPKGTVVNITLYDMHRNPKLYPDPEKFDPYRFLPENIEKRHPFGYIPFSGGPRNCIGQRYALLEIKVAIIGILRKFFLEPGDTPESIVLLVDLVLRPKNGIKVKFTLRK